jgi:hypothetical protein
MTNYVEIARQVLAATAGTSSETMEAVPEEYALAAAARPLESEDSAPTEMVSDPSPEELAHASAVLTKAGIRLMRIDGADHVGIWSDLDGPEVRAALRTFGSHELPVRYLDGAVLMCFRLRQVPGEPVPANVLAAMEQEPNHPWVVRDRMLAEMGWSPDGMPWSEWKAASLNRLFQEQGVTGLPGKITAATVFRWRAERESKFRSQKWRNLDRARRRADQ